MRKFAFLFAALFFLSLGCAARKPCPIVQGKPYCGRTVQEARKDRARKSSMRAKRKRTQEAYADRVLRDHHRKHDH